MSTPSKSDAAVHSSYALKPSRLTLLFQCCSLLIIGIVFYQILTLAELLLLLLLASASFLFFLNKDAIEVLAALDEQDWIIQYSKSKTKRHVQIKKMIDQYFYVVIYFKVSTIKPMVIWRDQLPRSVWKSLRVRAKLF